MQKDLDALKEWFDKNMHHMHQLGEGATLDEVLAEQPNRGLTSKDVHFVENYDQTRWWGNNAYRFTGYVDAKLTPALGVFSEEGNPTD